jgi:hypothetical protein
MSALAWRDRAGVSDDVRKTSARDDEQARKSRLLLLDGTSTFAATHRGRARRSLGRVASSGLGFRHERTIRTRGPGGIFKSAAVDSASGYRGSRAFTPLAVAIVLRSARARAEAIAGDHASGRSRLVAAVVVRGCGWLGVAVVRGGAVHRVAAVHWRAGGRWMASALARRGEPHTSGSLGRTSSKGA